MIRLCKFLCNVYNISNTVSAVEHNLIVTQPCYSVVIDMTLMGSVLQRSGM